MAEDKNMTDSDRIKELLAQLRATMDLEEAPAAAPENEETQAEEAAEGYAKTLEELLSLDPSAEESEEDMEEETEDGIEDTVEAETEENGEDIADERPDGEEGKSTAEEPRASSREKQTTGDQVAAALSAFFVVDESDVHGQVMLGDSFMTAEDGTDGAAPREEASEDAEEIIEETTEDKEDTAIFFHKNETVSLSFDDKISIAADSAISLPDTEEETEEEEVVSEGGFSPVLQKEETETFDGFPSLSSIETQPFGFDRRFSLSAFGEEDTLSEDAMRVTDEDGDENTDQSIGENTEETTDVSIDEETVRADEELADDAEHPAEAPAAEGQEATDETDEPLVDDEPLPFDETSEEAYEDEPAEEAFAEISSEDAAEPCEAEDALSYDEEGSPPDYADSEEDAGLSADPIPYSSEYGETGKSMVFERVADEGAEEDLTPPPAILDDTPACLPAPEETASKTEETVEVDFCAAAASESTEKAEEEGDGARHSPRIQLAPLAYRAKAEEKSDKKSEEAQNGEETEDFLSGIPGVMRHFLGDYPFGRVNRVQSAAEGRNKHTAEADETPVEKAKPKKKERRNFFAEEEEREYCDTADSELIRERLQSDLRNTRARFVVVSVFALLLLVLENYAFVPFFAEHSLLAADKVGYAEAFLLFGAALAAYPCLHMGACGIFYRRALPETILLFQWLLSFLYALVFAFLEIKVPHFAFVSALGLCVCLFFRMIGRENRISCFEHLTTAGDKLVFSPVQKKAMQAEINALGRSLDDEPPTMYRVRKTAFVDEFSYRTFAVCEDSVVNFVMLVLFLIAAVAAFAVTFALSGDAVKSFGALALALAAVPPLAMCATHVYPMARALRAAGNDSTILGEETVNEAVSLDAVAFEDIEAIPTKDVSVTFVQIYENPTLVLSYLNAIFRTVGGPLAGYFSAADQTKEAAKRKVVLTEAVSGGFAATVDGAGVCVGGGEYMEHKKTLPAFDAKDAKAESEGQSVLYVAMEGKVCAKFYIRYHVSAAFEKNVRRLSRLGITALIRTYDPCISDRTLFRISSLADQKVHVVNKTVAQKADFAAPHVAGGIVTSGHSGKLLQLLFLCFGTHRTIGAGRVMKLLLASLGIVASILMASLGFFDILPSALVALYHILWMFLSVLYVRCRIGIPKTTEGKRNEPSRDLRYSKGGH